MADRPMGSPSAPPRRPRNTEADELDALSVVLGADRQNTFSAKPSNPTEATIINALRRSNGSLTPVEIARDGQLGFLPLSKGLLELRQRGVITLGGSPGNEVVSLRSGSSGVPGIANIGLNTHLP
jgi:hypothetical protein